MGTPAIFFQTSCWPAGVRELARGRWSFGAWRGPNPPTNLHIQYTFVIGLIRKNRCPRQNRAFSAPAGRRVRARAAAPGGAIAAVVVTVAAVVIAVTAVAAAAAG